MTPPETSNPMFRALRHAAVDPDLAYEAAEYVQHAAGQNVIDVLIAHLETLKAEMIARIDSTNSRIDSTNSRIDSTNSRIDALDSRIDTLQKVIWPLVVSLAVALITFSAGLVYQAVTS